MILTFTKSLVSILTSVTIFILWQLYCSQTIIQPLLDKKETGFAYIATYPGYHNSLIIDGDRGWKEFSYGDWEVYGRSHINFWTGFASMGIPTQGALGFQSIEWDGKDTKGLAQQLEAINIIRIRVKEKAARELYKSLQSHIERGSSQGVFNSDNSLFFVSHPKDYMAWHTCNNMLIEWLELLGIEVVGNGWAGNFKKKSSM